MFTRSNLHSGQGKSAKQPKPVGTAAWHSDPLDFTHLHPSPAKWNLERRVAATNSAVVAAVD